MATAYLNKTLGGSGNKDKWTFSCWVKRHNTGVIHPLLHADDGSSNYYTHISFHDTDQLFFQNRWNNGNDGYKITTRMFRDTNAWYHLQFVWDSGNATADDRQIIYVNGERLTDFGGANVAVTQNRDTTINDGYEHRIGRGDTGMNGSQYANITLTHVHFADGQAYAPTVFGETDSTSGIWKPITNPSVTYGTNGFFLKMENSGAMGTDSSGNSNTFTVNGTLTQNVDSPTNNFATFNRNDRHAGSTNNYGDYITKGNTRVDISSAQKGCLRSTLGVSSGKWYWEAKIISKSKGFYGICNDEAFKTSSASIQGTTTASGVWFYENGPYYYAFNHQNNNTSIDSIANNDILCFALDMDNHAFYVRKNDSAWMNSGNPASGASRTGSIPELFTNGRDVLTNHDEVFINHYVDSSTGSTSAEYNFGSGFFGTTAVASANADGNGIGAFEYTVPTGYYALCTKNIKEFG